MTLKSKEAHRLLENIGKTLKVNQNIFDEMTKFTIEFIYGRQTEQNVGFEMELEETQINATNPTWSGFAWSPCQTCQLSRITFYWIMTNHILFHHRWIMAGFWLKEDVNHFDI